MFQITKNFSSGTRNVVKNIASEIVRECGKQGTTLSAEVASLGVVIFCLDPANKLSLTSQNDRSVLENFVRYCVHKFLDGQSPLVKTLEMQVFFLNNSIDPERVLKKYQANIDEKAQPLWKEIMEVENPNKDEQEKIFKKIMVYINMTYLLGSPTNAKVLLETSHALKSVVSQADLADFFVLKKKARAAQLKTIQEVVCGIRVFNKDAGLCGEGIRDIQADLQFAFENTKSALADRLESIVSREKKLANVLYTLYELDVEEDKIKLVLPEGIKEENFHYLKGMLTLNLQHESYVKNLMKILNQVKADIDVQLKEFRKVLDAIHEVVQYRTAVPTEKVFPQFTQVSILWQSLLNCIYMLIEINKVNENLSLLANMRLCDKIMGQIESKAAIRKIPKETSLAIQGLMKEMLKSALPYYGSHSLAIASATPITKFCPYLFLVGDGLLIPSRINAGFIKYENVLLSFSSSECAKRFLSDIEIYFTKFMNILRKHPEVVIFFDVYDIVSSYRVTDSKKVVAEEVAAVQNDCEVQTDLHPIPYNKDPNYTWNIWDLRRQAIKLANLKNCRTHSAQTNISFHRMNANLQTANPKENSCQTKCDAFTNITKHDASTECEDAEKIIGTSAIARCGIKSTQPLNDIFTVPYRKYAEKKKSDEVKKKDAS
ncbi:cilia- and flagella-associated protein 206 [Hermetia illucens]|uniref:cilia- and flagella-associated protein 206 n=1 Tax=Hermetia illucens TaxID=343691 RepID=UPI0018CBFC54|nr:cilia- and flagella-associated protein 206 [Hermetia illucens]